MPVMQKAQEIFGSLPFGAQKFIAEEMNIPMTDVYGGCDVLFPVCTGTQRQARNRRSYGETACYVKKAEGIPQPA